MATTKVGPAPDVQFLEEEELLEGLVQLTGGKLGIAHALLQEIIEKTDQELRKTLQEIATDVPAAVRKARRRISKRANDNMLAFLGARPDNVALHHIVAWGDSRAQVALEILLKWNVDPHDLPNLVYLPRFARHTPHPAMLEAVAHCRVHTNSYYANVEYMLDMAGRIPGATRENIVKAMLDIGRDLQAGTFPVDRLIEEV